MTLRKIDAKTTHDWMEQGKAVLIDVREPDEYIKEHVPEAHLVPLSGFNPEDFPQEHDKIAVFHCRSGGRTEAAATQILCTGFREVYQLDGGIQGWRKAGLQVNENAKAPISIMRQVQITAGILILLGVVLAVPGEPLVRRTQRICRRRADPGRDYRKLHHGTAAQTHALEPGNLGPTDPSAIGLVGRKGPFL